MAKSFVFIRLSIGVILLIESCSSMPQSQLGIQTPTNNSTLATTIRPNSIQGVVQNINQKEITILSSENKTIRLRLTTESRIWDGIDWVAKIHIEIGNDAIATGVWGENKSVFIVDNLYINIIYLKGVAEEVDKENLRFNLRDLRIGENTVIVNPLTTIYLSDSSQQGAFQDIQILPTPGGYVEVIGRKLNDGTIAAVNITLP